MEQTVAIRGQPIPIGRMTADRRQWRRTHPSASGQSLHTLPHSPQVFKGLGETRTRLQNQGSCGRCTAQESKDVSIAVLQNYALSARCAHQYRKVPCQFETRYTTMAKHFIDVDRLQAETTLEEAAAKCGAQLDARQTGKEARIDCPYGCPDDHEGRKEIAVNTEHPQKVFFCHAYQCGFRGNLLTLMHGWLTGEKPTGGRLTGAEFNRIKQVLAGRPPAALSRTPGPSAATPPEEPPAHRQRNVPLANSDNESARGLVDVDGKFVVETAQMGPKASAYVRRRPFLSPELMRKWRVGYLPTDGGGDKRGWSLRGNLVYPLLSVDDKVLGWIGRDPGYEEKLGAWEQSDRSKQPPVKHRFPKGLHRGLEFFGQQGSRLKEPGYREAIARHGILVVEGFNDVLALDALGIPAIGMMSNRMTEAQVEKLALWAKRLTEGKVSLMLDCEEPGDEGAKEGVWQLLQEGLDVRLAWTQAMHDGRFRGRQPESLTREEWMEVIQPAIIR